MKNRYLLSVVMAGLLALPGLISCNSGVFVDDFAPSAESISLASDGHAQVIDFKADNWDIFGVYTLTGETIRGDVYDADGQWLGDDPSYMAPGWTKYVLNHPTVALTVERTKGDKLCITSTENAGGKPFECFIDVGNDYDRRYIRVGGGAFGGIPVGQHCLPDEFLDGAGQCAVGGERRIDNAIPIR